jgi:ABC-2 type transport system permease protein
MKNPARSPFGAIFQAEVLLNTKRVVPYAMAILFGVNALLWWGWGPAAGRGWATNSDLFIASVLPVYSFLTLPLFTALIMADPVIRDFRIGVAPLIFCKPISRAEYLLGKFFGNFFVLVCCQAAFVLMLFVLQTFRRPGMIVQDVRAFPYLKHFLVFVVISHLVLAALYFAVGTLTRNAKIVYGLGVSFYPLYIIYQTVLLKSLPPRWRSVLDPLLMNWVDKSSKGRSAEWLNQLIVTYDSDLIANRALMILIAAICLAILYVRFTIGERPGKVEEFSTLSLSTAAEEVYYEPENFKHTGMGLFPSASTEFPESLKKNEVSSVPLPAVNRESAGIFAHLNKLVAAVGIEFRLLRSERSLVVILPLAMVLSFFSLPFQAAFSGETYSAAFASSTARGILVFLLGVIVFYTVEVMHRDREMRIEPVLWSMPVPNSVLLLSKFLTTISLALALIVLVGFTAAATQLLRGQTPVEVSAYLITYGVILFPTIAFMTAAVIALNVFLRDKYFAYAACIAISVGLIYLYKLGYNHWLYNPTLYGLWTYSDLTGAGGGQGRILTHRIYCLALSCLCLAFAQLGFRRKSAKRFIINGRLGSKGWALVVIVVSGLVAVVTGLMIK